MADSSKVPTFTSDVENTLEVHISQGTSLETGAAGLSAQRLTRNRCKVQPTTSSVMKILTCKHLL